MSASGGMLGKTFIELLNAENVFLLSFSCYIVFYKIFKSSSPCLASIYNNERCRAIDEVIAAKYTLKTAKYTLKIYSLL